jgi:drug/metabolite transporter (DMT)-like permease
MTRAFVIAIAAIGLLSAMDAMIKAQAASFPTPQIALLRFAFASLAILATLVVVRPPWPGPNAILANSWRAVLGVCTAVLFFYALGHLPLAETLALSLLSPCFTVLFGILLLREKVGRPILVALGFGLAGMLVIVAPKLVGPSLSVAALFGTAAALASALTYSLSLVLLRSRAARDHPTTIVAVQNIGGAAILGAFVPFAPAGTWLPLDGSNLVSFGVLGLLGASGHLLLTRAYSMAPAARMAPADYTALIFASIFGYVFFAETPAWTTIAGALLILASSFSATQR